VSGHTGYEKGQAEKMGNLKELKKLYAASTTPN